jgi:hypothetical protein
MFGKVSCHSSICCDAFPVGDEIAVAVGICVGSWVHDVCCLLLLKGFIDQVVGKLLWDGV